MIHLQNEYNHIKPEADRILNELIKQLGEIVSENFLSLAIPIEGRVKSWDSIQTKFRRKYHDVNSVLELPDLIGLRLVFLYLRDVNTAADCISNTFSIVEEEDAAERLGDSQFGYQSYHAVVRIPDEWAKLPTLSGCDKFKIEIQMRTLAQHAWAAASHNLQYKREGSVPEEVKRSINRVSALLETVDLEFERVLQERERYIEEVTDGSPVMLDVELLTSILNFRLPPENRNEEEDYSELVKDLQRVGIVDKAGLTFLIDNQLQEAVKRDQEIVEGKHAEYYGEDIKRKEKRTFFSHTGLIRYMLECIGKW